MEYWSVELQNFIYDTFLILLQGREMDPSTWA